MKTKIKLVLTIAGLFVAQEVLMAQSTSATNNLTGTLPASPTQYLGSYNGADVIFKSANVERMRIKSTGNVGIGTSNPAATLDVTSNTPINNNSDSYKTFQVIKRTSATTNRTMFMVPHVQPWGYNRLSQDGDVGLFWSDGIAGGGQNSASGLVIAPHAGSYAGIRINAQGNVGIGTPLNNNPNNYKLAVNGTIGAKAVKVEVSTATWIWPDYVFDTKYTLKSINELEAFINKNNHLPNVPSAKEVGKNGVDLGSMNAILLEKIEELSLYIIQQNKRIEVLEQKGSDKK